MKDESSSIKGAGKKALYRETNLQVIFGVTLMAVLGVSSITPVFPKMAGELNITTHETGLLITLFTLPGVILTPVLGIMADRIGRKKILIPSLFLFSMAGAACGFIRDFDILLIFRFFQGVGAASLGSINVTVIGDIYTGKDRAAAMGYNASVLSIGTAVYPALGGALATLAWYYPFFLPLAAIPVGFAVIFLLKNPEPKNNQHLKGYLADVVKNIKNMKVFGLFIASVITFIILYGSYLTYFPFLMRESFKSSPLIIGVMMSISSLSTALTSSRLGILSGKYSSPALLRFAFILYALSMILIPFVHIIWLLLIPIVIFGIAQGINIPNIQTMLAKLAPMEYRAAFMSINGMVLRLGQTLGPIVIGLFFTLWGIDGAFYAGTGFAALMFLIVVIMIK